MRLLIFLFLILSIAACKKESENRSPEIRITAPTDGRTYLVGDTVLIEAEVKDDRLIKSLKLSLFETASKRTAGEVKYFQLNTQQHSFSYEYIIDKKDIQSGLHYFELMADDGESQNVAFVSIQVQQKTLKSMGLIFIASTPLGLELYKQKTPSGFEKLVNINAAYADAKINPVDQQLWLMPKGNSDMVVFDLKSLSIVNQIAAPITQSQDAFSLLHYDDRTFFVGSNNGTLEAYNHQFIDMFTYKALEQYSPKLIASDATYLLIVEQAQQFNKSRIRLLYRISGAVISTSLLQKNIIGLQMISKDRAFLISKITNGIELLDYDVKRGVSRQLQQLNNSSEVFLSFDKFKNGGFLFVTNQGMYTFTLPNQLNRFSNRPVENVNYDKLRDEILMVNEDTLVVFDATTLLQKQSILFPEKLKAALPWSNR